ncbi:hypothetical protein scyTo_0019634 [Scyliorhinus torazame]|uniref:Uncharacterized protein n=1 Tax=Scyliorhinus torazame TaxID=75743 RepID=A0A401Q3M8_SCYTO|nr:hypothetical protein [Scyliorhinus torazame]
MGVDWHKRRQRGTVELAVGDYAAGISTVNALDIAEISEEIEVMKRQMRATVKDIYQDAETATDLSQQVNQLVWRERKQLQPYQTTISELINRQSAISKEVYRVQACNMYASHLLQSVRANLLQLAAHRMPNWSITIGRHELTPDRDVSIVEADDIERTDDDQRIHRYVHKGLARLGRT